MRRVPISGEATLATAPPTIITLIDSDGNEANTIILKNHGLNSVYFQINMDVDSNAGVMNRGAFNPAGQGYRDEIVITGVRATKLYLRAKSGTPTVAYWAQ